MSPFVGSLKTSFACDPPQEPGDPCDVLAAPVRVEVACPEGGLWGGVHPLAQGSLSGGGGSSPPPLPRVVQSL